MGTLYEAARIECRFGNNFVTAAVTSSVSVCADQEWTTIFFILKLPISQGSQSITCKAPPFNYGVRVPLSITLNRWLSRRLISFMYHFAEEVCLVQSGLQHHFRLLDLPVVIGRKLHDRTRFVLYTIFFLNKTDALGLSLQDPSVYCTFYQYIQPAPRCHTVFEMRHKSSQV